MTRHQATACMVVFALTCLSVARGFGQDGEPEYGDYLLSHAGASRPAGDYRVSAAAYLRSVGGNRVLRSLLGSRGPVLETGESGETTWSVEIGAAGLYEIAVGYFPVPGKGAPIERELLINGRRPFREARSLILQRVWMDAPRAAARDNRGNDIRPMQVEQPRWSESVLRDVQGYYPDPYLFYLGEGMQTITLRSVREPVALEYLRVFQASPPPSYAQARERYFRYGYAAAADACVKVQAEDGLWKSDPSLYPTSDNSSPATEPSHPSQIRLNTVGATGWRYPGQRITWEVVVPEAGLYTIALRIRQNQVRGVRSVRSLYLNSEIPFQEARDLPFSFDRSWRIVELGAEGAPYLFHFQKGRNTVGLEVSLGELSEVVRRVEGSVFRLNELYRKIVMITGTVPDPFRDYQLEQRIPGLLDVLHAELGTIQQARTALEEAAGKGGGTTTVLQRLSRQMEDMIRAPETVAERLDAFKVNIGALGAWAFEVRQLPLELDYLMVQSPGKPLPPAEAGFAARLARAFHSFLASFTVDYNAVGSVADRDTAVDVWLVGGLSQATIIRTLMDEGFCRREGIGVNFMIADSGIILPSIVSGRGPDVILNVRRGQPVDLALRHAVRDLSGFPGFQDVVRRFSESAVLPFRWAGGVFALPETQLFNVMFYRKDVLAALGVQPPRTWDEVYALIPALQKNNLELGMPFSAFSGTDLNAQPVNPAFAMLLFQGGGELYRDHGARSALDSEEAIRAFTQWTELYTSFKLPLDYALQQSFRTGAMPIGIASFNFYNVLTVFAPEIRGLWSFAPVPATRQADGALAREVPSEVTGAVILSSSRRPQDAWKLLDWWTSTETQLAYGRDMESILGPGARYPTANEEALLSLGWPVDVIRVLQGQWDGVRGVPEVPGGYFTGRHLENAFRTVVMQGGDPRDTLLDFVEDIDKEITIKRREFGLE